MHAAGDGEEQGHRVIRHGVVQQAGRVGDDDTLLRRSGYIDGVVANAPARDEFEIRGFLRPEHGGGELVHAGEDGVHTGQQREQLGFAERASFWRMHEREARGTEQIQRASSDGFDVERARGNQDIPGHGGGVCAGGRET